MILHIVLQKGSLQARSLMKQNQLIVIFADSDDIYLCIIIGKTNVTRFLSRFLAVPQIQDTKSLVLIF